MSVVDGWTNGLPPAAHNRVERQKSSATASSLFSAAGAASARSAGLAPVGEVFGSLVMNLGWSGSGCNMWWAGGSGGFGGGYGGVNLGGGVMSGGLMGGGWMNQQTPITTSRSGQYAGFAPYVKAYEYAWNGALQRMLAEARALGAHGVVGATITRERLEGSVWEFIALGTAVRSVDPTLVPTPNTSAGELWATNLSVEDATSAILSGFLPREIILAMSVATKHEDWQLKQQRTSWSNTEVTSLSELIQVARNEARGLLSQRATHVGGAELVVTDMRVSEFDTPCGQETDVHAEAVMIGTTLVPAPHRHPDQRAGARPLTILPLRT